MPRVDYLVIGLGNPGSKYARTRHNAGYLVVSELVSRYSADLKSRRRSMDLFEAQVSGKRLALGQPRTFMNLSGQAVGPAYRKYRISDSQNLLVVHDELDLPPGKIKIKAGGGTAGHKGLASIQAVLGTADFIRIRVGIGRPPPRKDTAEYVLEKPKGDFEGIEKAADAAEALIAEGPARAMEKYNT